MDVAGYLPGLPGLFISGIFAAALSSMSSMLNTLAGTIFDDFLRNRMPNVTEKKASSIMKVYNVKHNKQVNHLIIYLFFN